MRSNLYITISTEVPGVEEISSSSLRLYLLTLRIVLDYPEYHPLVIMNLKPFQRQLLAICHKNLFLESSLTDRAR